MVYRIGTRKSDLALTQSNWVKDQLERRGLHCELVHIESDGDRQTDKPLYEIESPEPGLFTKRLEKALLENVVDIAVHSLKDLPTEQPDGLVVAAIPEREIANDVLVTRGKPLGKGVVIGTSSLRREALLKAAFPEVEIVPLRGNVPTRLRAVVDRKLDGVVLASAGLRRLGVDLSYFTYEVLAVDRFVPAPGQGALAIEIRKESSSKLTAALAEIHHLPSANETRVERKILRELEGGCTLPLGVRCIHLATSKQFRLHAFLGLARQNKDQREWYGFERFDNLGSSQETLVKQAVKHFREFMERKSHESP